MAHYPGNPGLVDSKHMDEQRLFYTDPEVALGAKFNLTQPTDHVTEMQHETQMIFDYDQLGLRNVLGPGKRTPHMTGRHV